MEGEERRRGAAHLEQAVARRVETEGDELLSAVDGVGEHVELGDGGADLMGKTHGR